MRRRYYVCPWLILTGSLLNRYAQVTRSYKSDLADKYFIMEKLAVLPTIRTGSLIVVESPVTREIMFAENMELLKHRRYGSITLDILRKN